MYISFLYNFYQGKGSNIVGKMLSYKFSDIMQEKNTNKDALSFQGYYL
jgi:hypothetical protein